MKQYAPCSKFALRVCMEGKISHFKIGSYSIRNCCLQSAYSQVGDEATLPVYSRAMAVRKDPDAFADALTGVYATDPHYGYKLKAIMEQNGYYKYDVQEGPSPNVGKTGFA